MLGKGGDDMAYAQAKAEIQLLCDACNKDLKYTEKYLFGREVTEFFIEPCECYKYKKEE